MSQTAPRIAPLQPPYAPEIQQQFDRIMRGAPPLVLFRVMAGNARAWEKFRAGSLLGSRAALVCGSAKSSSIAPARERGASTNGACMSRRLPLPHT